MPSAQSRCPLLSPTLAPHLVEGSSTWGEVRWQWMRRHPPPPRPPQTCRQGRSSRPDDDGSEARRGVWILPRRISSDAHAYPSGAVDLLSSHLLQRMHLLRRGGSGSFASTRFSLSLSLPLSLSSPSSLLVLLMFVGGASGGGWMWWRRRQAVLLLVVAAGCGNVAGGGGAGGGGGGSGRWWCC
jgi:hypothetical protein